MSNLKVVDKLTITFLVDNALEWFIKLPPGFSHELRQHLTEHNPQVDALTGAPFMDLENYCCGAHGFSALIETQAKGEEPHLTLFDTGPDSRAIARNLAAMHVPVGRVERVVLSHWHADHSGGMLSFLRVRAAQAPDAPPIVADLHPDRPIARGIKIGETVACRLPDDPKFEELAEVGAVVEKHAEGHAVAGGTVWVSGEIPRVTEFEGGILGGIKWVESATVNAEGRKGEWAKDELIMDERYAAIDVAGKGLVIFSACSHAGIVNVARDAVSTFKRPIHMIIGGLHLATPDLADRIAPTVDFFANKLRPSPTYVLPMHCTGFPAKVALEHALGEGVVPAGVGMKVEVTGDWEAEPKIFAPSVAV
ncbi:beta-lactamase-like protein [Amylocystis lapponica]|nr:beta-lactamase-like protein [Amylocystis lapponica]